MRAAAALLLIVAALPIWASHARAGVVRADTAEGEGEASAGDALAGVADAVLSLGASMRLSDAGLQAIMRREGFSAMKYADASGYSVGYGHFILPGENFDGGISEEQAGALLRQDVGKAENAVNARVTVSLTQDQFDALVSFIFNVGAGAFAASTLLRVLNSGDYYGAAEQFGCWVYSTSGGVRQVNAALVSRRQDEAAQFAA